MRTASSSAALLRLVRALAVLVAVLVVAAAPARADDAAEAANLVKSAKASLEKFLSYKEWEAIGNLLGAARAIYIAPEVTKGGFLLAASGGKGVLLRRHGADWSDPIFMEISSQSLGMQAGGAESNLLMLIMTDVGVDDLVSGVSKVGGSGGFALGSWGASANAAGGASGGLQVLTVSTNSGVFGGSGFERTEMKPVTGYLDAIYGKGAPMAKIVAGAGKGGAGAGELQALLKKTTQAAWDVKP
jgi:lipid-binding SYLF domain-containing protein